MAGIYVHIPFCRQACHYCDFHFSTVMRGWENMVEAIGREATLRASINPAWKSLEYTSLYFGGGTPSLLNSDAIQALVAQLESVLGFSIHDLQEVTLEANPEDLEEQKLKAWLESGINRLSIGIQSFDDTTLRWMNRLHTGQQAHDGVHRAHRAGFESISIDLIYGVPTSRKWEDDVQRALELPIRHLSAYSLTVEPKTVLGARVRQGTISEVPESKTAAEYDHLCRELTNRGWNHYETSNWASPNPLNGDHWKAVHNSAYWKGAPYLGLGPGAHGYFPEERYANKANNQIYLRAIQEGQLDQEVETLSSADRYNEAVMTGLRTAAGISLEQLEKATSLRPDVVDPKAWQQAIERGDLRRQDDGTFRIPERKWITGDRIAASLFWVA